jgi:hypothetical protein
MTETLNRTGISRDPFALQHRRTNRLKRVGGGDLLPTRFEQLALRYPSPTWVKSFAANCATRSFLKSRISFRKVLFKINDR